jgi:hypothetical protein
MNEQQLAAVKQALELMHNRGDVGVDEWIAAEAAIKQALAQDALDKMADNARELGLDYEPALMQQPATLDEMHAIGNGIMYGEQPPVQEGRDWSLLEATQESLREHMAEIKRLKAAQPAVPLTFAQLCELETKATRPDGELSLVGFARAIEAHHGITAAPEKGGAA